MRHAWLFEAESIQSYLHGTNRLRDAVGASQIVDALCGAVDEDQQGSDLLSRVLGAVPAAAAPESIAFARRGGGAFIALFADAGLRDRVRGLWTLALDREAPGLAWVDAVADGVDDLSAARLGMQGLREARLWRGADLPEAGPLVLRAPRTGTAAVDALSIGGTREIVDAATSAKQAAGRQAQRVTSRFVSDGPAADAPPGLSLGAVHWPSRLSVDEDEDVDERTVFPLRTDENQIAFLHADGNGLGAALQALSRSLESKPEAYAKTYGGFSAAISRATVAAARDATLAVLLPARDRLGRIPARPLVLGGDDLSIIVRPDLAVAFAQSFQLAFERHTQKLLEPFVALGCPPILTAACGIAVVHARHPFDRAASMAEWLCGEAKRRTKRVAGAGHLPPSTVMWHRETASLPADDEDWLAGYSVSVLDSGSARRLSLAGGPYLVGAPIAGQDQPLGLPSIPQLRVVAELLNRETVSVSGIREALGLLVTGHDASACLRLWLNWREALHLRDAQTLREIDAGLRALGVAEPERSPFTAVEDGVSSTPLLDAMLLAAWCSFDTEADRG